MDNVKTILVVDDAAICREPIAASLRMAGYNVICAGDGRQAWSLLEHNTPNLVLLDLAMPNVDGLSLLEAIRANDAWPDVPIVVLSAVTETGAMERARGLGVQAYLQKSNFSLEQLLRYVKQLIGPGHSSSATAPASATVKQAQATPPPPPATRAPLAAVTVQTPQHDTTAAAGAAAAGIAPPPTLHRDQTIRRIATATAGKTLAGIVARVVSMGNDPRTAVSDMVALLRTDSVLASRVLKVANSADYATRTMRVASVEEAVRNIGVGTVAKLATTVGIFEAFPPDSIDGFNHIRCWQHSFAVAALTEAFASAASASDGAVAHLVGLCHDLGEILLRQFFSKELNEVRSYAAATGKPAKVVEAGVFGMTRQELHVLILSHVGLPQRIIEPIRDLHMEAASSKPLVRVLQLADAYANGLMLASSPDAPVWPFTTAECKALFGEHGPPGVSDHELRCDVQSTTALLSRLSDAEQEKLHKPLFPHTGLKIWYARHSALSAPDPLSALLRLLANVQSSERLPQKPEELDGIDAVVVAVLRGNAAEMSLAESLRACAGRPVLYLHGGDDLPAQDDPGVVTVRKWPLPLSDMAKFVLEVMQGATPALSPV